MSILEPGQMSTKVKRFEPPIPDVPEADSLRVYVCGLPSSGNRLIVRLLNAAGVKLTGICHGHATDVPINTQDASDIRCILLVRSHPHRLTSAAKTNHEHGEPTDTERMMKLMKGIVEIGAPTRWISYESLLLDPEETKKDLLEWLGLPEVDWPEIVFDANEKHRTGIPDPKEIEATMRISERRQKAERMGKVGHLTSHHPGKPE